MTSSGSRLERILRSGRFCVTAELVPPRSAGPGPLRAQARSLVGYADAVNVTDNPTPSARMSPLAGVAVLAASGLEPILQLTCRDRNRLALTADLLGGWALGARGVLCLSGDPVQRGDHPDAAEVRDLSVLELVGLAVALRQGRTLSGGEVEEPPRYLIGVADSPLAPGYDPSRLEAKIDAGADFVQTQIVYDVEAFAAWADLVRPRGVLERASVIAGVVPLRSVRQARFLDGLPGVRVPPGLIRRLEQAGPDAAEVGSALTVDLLAELQRVPHVAGVHLMALGKDGLGQVIEAAGLLPRPTVAA
ncbi:MAG TPA: methylenetetrahydrofolate reductase [Actinomycetota bacterium]|nr:methylenetetrahydrofolate reductase [Actinomycetota bacterium]